MDTFVIAKAHGGRPLRRILRWRRGGYIGVSNPETSDFVEDRHRGAIGFRAIDVIPYNTVTYEELLRLWHEGEPDALREAWARLNVLLDENDFVMYNVSHEGGRSHGEGSEPKHEERSGTGGAASRLRR